MEPEIEKILREIVGRISSLEATLKSFLSNCRCKEHEARIRKIEDRTTILWALIFIGGGVLGWALELWLNQ